MPLFHSTIVPSHFIAKALLRASFAVPLPMIKANSPFSSGFAPASGTLYMPPTCWFAPLAVVLLPSACDESPLAVVLSPSACDAPPLAVVLLPSACDL